MAEILPVNNIILPGPAKEVKRPDNSYPKAVRRSRNAMNYFFKKIYRTNSKYRQTLYLNSINKARLFSSS